MRSQADHVVLFGLPHPLALRRLFVVIANQVQHSMDDIQQQFVGTGMAKFGRLALGSVSTDYYFALQKSPFGILFKNETEDIGFVIVGQVLHV